MENKQLTNITPGIESDALDFLRYQIDGLCSEIVTKYKLYDSRGRPRNAFVLNALTKYGCIGCVTNLFTQPPRWSEIDAIYKENHSWL